MSDKAKKSDLSEINCVTLTVSEASDPSESGDGNMRHIPIHAEGEGGGVC